MADIFVPGFVTTTQTPGAGFNVIVAQQGTIATTVTGDGIVAAGNNRILLAGQILTTNFSGIAITGSSVSVDILKTGSIGGVYGIVGNNVNSNVDLKNAGGIYSSGYALYMAGSTIGSSIKNTGQITGNIELGSSGDSVNNIGGTITGNLYLGEGYNIFNNTNGFLTGDVSGGNGGNIFNNNDGVIVWAVSLGTGYDYFSNLRGTVRGDVFLGGGDDFANLSVDAQHGILTIYGATGFDTLNFEAATSAIWLDMEYTQMEVWTSGTGIATGANANTMVANIDSFEKIIGTVGSDTILGDSKDNSYIYIGNFSGTADVFFGRGGVDTIDLSILKSVWVDLNYSSNEVFTSGTNLAYGYNSNIVVANLDSVERIIGTTGSDLIYGDAGDNIFVSKGVAYNNTATLPSVIELDRFDGRGGSDTIDVSSLNIYGGVWVDLNYAGPQVWVAYNQNFANGGNANVAVAQLTAVENLVGTFYSDQFYGDANANTYFFNGFDGAHTELFDGRGGVDTFDASLFNYGIWASLAYTAMEVWTGFSQVGTTIGATATTAVADLVSVDNLVGTRFGDTLSGDGNANRIEGGKGNDVLIGYLGADTFVFNFDVVNNVGMGADTINDFAYGSAVGHDVIQLSGYSTNQDTFAELMLNTYNTASGVHIQFNDGSSIDLLGLIKSQLTADDFLFV